MPTYTRMTDVAGFPYAVKPNTTPTERGEIPVHVMEPRGELSPPYHFPYCTLEQAGLVFLDHTLTRWLATDERTRKAEERLPLAWRKR